MNDYGTQRSQNSYWEVVNWRNDAADGQAMNWEGVR